MLEVLGLSDLEERAYLALLAAAGASVAEISHEVGASEEQVRGALSSLETKGLASRGAGEHSGFVPAPPDAAIEVLVMRRQQELESVRLFSSQLLHRFHAARETKPVELIEIISGRAAVAQRYEQMQLLAKREVLNCDRPPYATPIEAEMADPTTPVDNHIELAALNQGIVYRAIYDTAALEVPGRARSAQILMEAGEQARTMSGLPMKMSIVDRRIALLPLNIHAPDQEMESALIQPSALLDALVTLFEALWERALPLALHADASHEAGEDDLSPRDQNILSLVSGGLSDESVARQLGVGVRTVQRRMNLLMERLNARSRFQAALLAAKKGWIKE
ncbi:MAG: helix-turn-helix domain-containing protein [Actinomycetota bacterium]